MIRSIGRAVVALVALSALAAPAAAQTAGEVLAQARAVYYSLEGRGLASFQCRVTPDWKKIAAGMGQANAAETERILAMLRQLQTSVTVAVGQPPQVTHSVPSTVGAQEAQTLQQVQQGVGQMVSGFFDSWSLFVLTSVLPARNDAAELKEESGQHHLVYSEGGSRFTVVMQKDFVIRSHTMESSGTSGTFWPQFQPTLDGLLLTTFQAEFRGPQPHEAGSGQVSVIYQDVAGFQLPKTIAISAAMGGDNFQIDVEFSDCQVTKR